MKLLFLYLGENQWSMAAIGLVLLILPFLLGYFIGLTKGRKENTRYKYQ